MAFEELPCDNKTITRMCVSLENKYFWLSVCVRVYLKSLFVKYKDYVTENMLVGKPSIIECIVGI